MKHNHLRSLLALAVLTLLPAAFGQEVTKPAVAPEAAAKTFVIQDGAKPWHDRDYWMLTQVPETLKSTAPLPQQNCTSRALDIPGKPASVTIGVAAKDSAKFMAKYPTAQKAADTITITNPKAAVITYEVFTLAQPPARIEGGFGAGLILIKLSAE